MKGRSEIEHTILFSGITVAVVKCLCNNKLRNIGPVTINPNIVAFILILCYAVTIKILYNLQFTHCIDKYIGRNHGDKGLFCILLLPTALIFTCINFGTLLSSEYKATTLISVELALSSVVVLLLYKFHQNYFQCVFLVIVVNTLAIIGPLHLFGIYCMKMILLSILSQCLFFWLLDTASSFSKSFTMGELNLVCQGIVIFLVSACFHFSTLIYRNETIYLSAVNSMIFIALTGLLIVLFLLRIFPVLRLTFYFYIVCIGIAGTVILVSMGVAFKQNPVLWFVYYISETKTRINLMIYCVICSSLTFLFILWQQSRFEESSTVTRKFFHGVVVAVYIPAFVLDMELLLLASTLIFGIFILLECIRVLNIFPLGDIIQNGFCIFLDEKDSGVLMLTHLYLFLGSSITLWIYPFDLRGMNTVCIGSGILALGIGDSVASIVGTYFGKHKWPHTKKTYEGTFSAFVIQFFGTLFIFFLLNQILSLSNLVFVLLATAHSVLLETFTTQVDNLVSPFYLYIMFVCL